MFTRKRKEKPQKKYSLFLFVDPHDGTIKKVWLGDYYKFHNTILTGLYDIPAGHSEFTMWFHKCIIQGYNYKQLISCIAQNVSKEKGIELRDRYKAKYEHTCLSNACHYLSLAEEDEK